MFPRLMCGVFAVAMAGPCLAQDPTKPAAPATPTVEMQYSYSTTSDPNRRPPVAGVPIGRAYRNTGSSGSYCTYCGPGTQYLACDCCLRLDLSNGVGLWDPCNCWRPHPAPCCTYGCR